MLLTESFNQQIKELKIQSETKRKEILDKVNKEITKIRDEHNPIIYFKNNTDFNGENFIKLLNERPRFANNNVTANCNNILFTFINCEELVKYENNVIARKQFSEDFKQTGGNMVLVYCKMEDNQYPDDDQLLYLFESELRGRPAILSLKMKYTFRKNNDQLIDVEKKEYNKFNEEMQKLVYNAFPKLAIELPSVN